MSYPANPPPYPGTEYAQPGQPVQIIHIQPMPVRPVVVGGMGSDPSTIVCASCHYQVVTKTESRPTTKTHIWALCLCVFGFWPCAWLPYCMPSCMNTDHYCPNCNAFLGNYGY